MKTKRLFILFSLISLLTLTACSTQDSLKVSDKEPIVIGATLALSGTYSFIGQPEAKGIQLAIEELNQAGGVNGRQLEAVIEDNAGDVKKAVTSVNKLIDVDKSDVILSAFTHITQAVKEVTKDRHKILLYNSTANSMAEEGKYTFKDYFDAQEHGAFVADLINQAGYKQVSAVSETSQLCSEFIEKFIEQAQKNNISIIKKSQYQPDKKDFKTIILNLEADKVNAIINCTWKHTDVFMKTIKEMDLINTPTFHLAAVYLPSMDTPKLRNLYQENQMVSTWYGFTKNSDNSKYPEFKEKFVTKYGEEPTPDAVYFYDDMFVLRDALKACDDRGLIRNNDCIAEELLKTDYYGAGGHLTFDEHGVSSRDVFAIQVKDGEWVEVK